MDGFGVPGVSTNEATKTLQALYEDIQHVLKVPVVHVIFRTAALYESFLQIAWKQVRPNMLTTNVKKAAEMLRYPALHVQVPHVDWSYYYREPTLARIRSTLFIFNEMNAKLLLIASAWAESLSNRSNPGGQQVNGTVKPGMLPGLSSVDLIHIPDAPPPVRSLLLDIAEQHHHPDVASDFRALAHYPQFLRTSWIHLRRFVGTSEYFLLREKLKVQSIQLTKDMPYPVTVNRERLAPHYSNAKIAGITGIIAMFQNLLPDLIIDGEFLRRMLTST